MTPTVTALLALAAAVTRNPELGFLSIPTGALAGAVTKQGAALALQAMRDRTDRVQDFADAIADETHQQTEGFLSEHVDNAEKRKLLGHAVDAATDAASAWKVKTLARAFVRGIEKDERVRDTALFIELLRDLDEADAAFLAAAQRCDSDRWTILEVVSQDPDLEASAAFIRRRLSTVGLIREVAGADAEYALTDLGYSCGRWLRSLGTE